MYTDPNEREFKKWKAKNLKGRSYAHFDVKVNFRNDFSKIWGYISDPKNIAVHGFYPFIHFEINQPKYKFDDKKGVKCVKPKPRQIYYSSHIDRYIFSYYGYKLNQFYNERLVCDGTDDVSIAYRNNKETDNDNIFFAKKAFEGVKDLENCYVIIGDFKNFFDELDHNYLKERLLDLMGIESCQLPDDFYTVFKNITRFSFWEIGSLFSLNNIKVSMKNPESIRRAYVNMNKKEQVLGIDDFKKHKKEFVSRNQTEDGKIKTYGVPQGSAISAVLSNVYMIEFDKKMREFVMTENNGLYMRYSDDFIVVLPKQDDTKFTGQYDQIRKILESVPRLILEPQKTQIFLYEQGKITRKDPIIVNQDLNESNLINYLGFTFDGNKLTIRDKTLSKYYYRMYRKIKTITNSRAKGKKRSAENLYAKYTIKGAYPDKTKNKNAKGNFLTYANRVKREFANSEYDFGVDVSVDKFVTRHMLKVKRRLTHPENDAEKDI